MLAMQEPRKLREKNEHELCTTRVLRSRYGVLHVRNCVAVRHVQIGRFGAASYAMQALVRSFTMALSYLRPR